ncbi:MAG: tyrosine-type recombinase/integrase [Pseudonocardiaceae bacterium]
MGQGDARRGLAPGTIHTRFNNGKAVLRGAVRDRLIAADPSEGVTLPRRRRRRSDVAMTLPTDVQVRALLDAAEAKFTAFIALAAFAGLRLEEAAGLQVGDIEFLRRTLAVSRQVQRNEGGGGVEIRLPKYGSERVVYLPDGLVQLLAQHIEQHRQGTDPTPWLFEGAPGDPPHQNTVSYWWRKTQQSAGISGMRMHEALFRLRPDRYGL